MGPVLSQPKAVTSHLGAPASRWHRQRDFRLPSARRRDKHELMLRHLAFNLKSPSTMKTILRASLLCMFTFSLLTSGCGKSEPPVADTTPALQQAFEAADPALKERVAALAADLKAQKLVEATKTLEQIVSGSKLSEVQQQAISRTILEINEIAANNPQLDTQEMFAARAKLFQSLRRSAQ